MERNKATSGQEESLKNVKNSNIMNLCRVCMTPSKNMSEIFDAKSNITGKIQFCTGVRLIKEDGLPTWICNKCLTDLSVAHKFKKSYLLADRTFRKLLLGDKIKTEKPDTSTNNLTDDAYCDRTDDEDDDYFTDDIIKNEVIDEESSVDVRKNNNVLLCNGKNASMPEVDKGLTIISQKKRVTYKRATPRFKKLKFKRLACEACDIKFKNREQSLEHKKKMHGEDTWICEICGKFFKHRSSLYSHVRSHLPPQHACEHCDYRTWHKSDLTKHLRIHLGLKLYQCEFCTRSYHTSSNLTEHIRRVHEHLRRYPCKICDRAFTDNTKLNRHLDSHNDIKRYECSECHSFFTRRCYWKKHLQRQHSVTVPPQRPGRQKTNFLIGEDLITAANKPDTAT